MIRDLFGNTATQCVAPIIDGPSLDLVLHHETHTDEQKLGAIKVSDDGRESKAVWLPKSAIEFFRGSLNTAGITRSGQIVRLPVVTVTVPESLAKEKGLI